MKLPTDQETEAVLAAPGPTQFLKNRLLTHGPDEMRNTAKCKEEVRHRGPGG